MSGISMAGKDVERRYTARVYYLERNTIHIAIFWDTRTHYQVITIRVPQQIHA